MKARSRRGLRFLVQGKKERFSPCHPPPHPQKEGSWTLEGKASALWGLTTLLEETFASSSSLSREDEIKGLVSNSSEISYSVHKEVRNWSTRWNHAWKSLYFRWNQNSVIHSQWGRPRKSCHTVRMISTKAMNHLCISMPRNFSISIGTFYYCS